MKRTVFLILVSHFLVFTNCKEDNVVSNEPIELRENLSAQEFSDAIIGKWQSVFEKEGEENVKYLEFDKNGNAKIIMSNNLEREYKGKYILSFSRPPENGMVTLAEISIKSESENILLEQVNFGLHNAFLISDDLFLRIDKPPYGVLEKVNK